MKTESIPKKDIFLFQEMVWEYILMLFIDKGWVHFYFCVSLKKLILLRVHWIWFSPTIILFTAEITRVLFKVSILVYSQKEEYQL